MSLTKNGWHLRDAVDLFVTKASELKNTIFLKEKINLKMKVGYSQEKGFYTELDELEENEIRSVLVIVRQFVSDNEPIYLRWICPYLVKFTNDKPSRDYLDYTFNYWKKAIKSGDGIITINKKQYTPEYVLKMYINGYYFHSDPNLYKEYQELSMGWMSGMLIQHLFQSCLLNTIGFIDFVSSYIEHVQEKGYLIIPDTEMKQLNSN